jgi:hypothetical protein
LISRGDPLSILWVASLDEVTKKGLFEGPRQGQDSIQNSDIMALGRGQFSPAAMNKRLSDLESHVNTARAILVGLFVALAVDIVVRSFL